MKLNFKLNLKKKPKNIAHFSYSDINASKDWHRILGTFFAVSLIGVIWSAYLFYHLEYHVAPAGITTPAAQNDAGISRLHKVISKYDSRKEAYDKAIETEPNIADPSL